MAKTPDMGRDTRFWANGWNSHENRQRDPDTYELFKQFQPQMINANAPDHRRTRSVYDKAFRPGDMTRVSADDGGRVPEAAERAARG